MFQTKLIQHQGRFVQSRVSAKFDFIHESLRNKFSCILFAYSWWLDAVKRREKITRENAFEQKKKKPGL